MAIIPRRYISTRDDVALSDGSAIIYRDGEFVAGPALENADGTWELSLDSALGDDAFGKAFVGCHAGALYLFGSAGEHCGDMSGIFRWNRVTQAWDEVASGAEITGKDFNGSANYGVASFNGHAYVGDRRTGKLRRLDLNPDGSFSALTDAAQVGFEDILFGPVIDGKLTMGNYGRGTPIPGVFEAPDIPANSHIYTYDGTTVASAHEFTDLGSDGTVLSMALAHGLLWVTLENADGTVHEVWTLDPADWTATLVLASGARRAVVCNWNGELWMARRGASANDTDLAVWRDSAFVTQAVHTVGSGLGAPATIVPHGDRVLVLGSGSFFYGFDGTTAVEDFAPTGNHSIVSVAYHDGYLWVTTLQPVKLYRRRVGLDSRIGALFRPQTNAAGRA